MHKIILASASIVLLLFGAAGANAMASDEQGYHYVKKTPHEARMSYGSSSAPEGRAAYSARYALDNGAHAHDPAFSPQQDEIYDAR